MLSKISRAVGFGWRDQPPTPKIYCSRTPLDVAIIRSSDGWLKVEQ
jgi:hypothetical protein